MDPIFGCDLWLIAGKAYDSYILLYAYFKTVVCSRGFFTAARFSSLFTSLLLNSSYWYLVFSFVDCCLFAV